MVRGILKTQTSDNMRKFLLISEYISYQSIKIEDSLKTLARKSILKCFFQTSFIYTRNQYLVISNLKSRLTRLGQTGCKKARTDENDSLLAERLDKFAGAMESIKRDSDNGEHESPWKLDFRQQSRSFLRTVTHY